MSGTSTKYYLLSFLGALVMAVGVLAVAPSAQAQQRPIPITVDKECNPNPVQVGQPLTCIIDVGPAFPQVFAIVMVEDTLPTGLTVTGATQQQFFPGGVVTDACTVTGNTVVCPLGLVAGELNRFGVRTLRVTIEAIAQQCGTFTNTAVAEALNGGETVTATKEITVEGCEVPPAPEPAPEPGQPQEGAPAPITQDFEQESESGEIDQTFEVS